ncbi:MAG TPA: DNA polymerase III subunit alpha, partial [bacterium]|nr:DNA polymerase III subunit alpha [bacterium]
VATNDCHYLLRSDSEAQDLLLCIQTQKTLDDPNRLRFSSDQFYLKSPEEMIEQLGAIPGAIENTLAIAERCNLNLELGTLHMPSFPLPDGESRSPYEYLRDLVYKGAKIRYRELTEELRDRIEFELDVIHRMKFDSYFLIVWDFVRYAKENGVSVGPGRGSAAGSIVAFCLFISDIEPIQNNLLFERFLNPDRVSPPDIDIDFSDQTRGKVIRYVTEKYGEQNVSQIATFSTIKAKNAIKDVGRVLGVSIAECDRITKIMPNDPNLTLESALTNSELREIAESDETHRRLFRLASRLEGLIRQTGVHAAGMIISDRNLSEMVPLMRTNKGEVCAQYEKNDLEEIGLIKMDFLGLKTLSFIDECLRLLKEDGIEIDLSAIPEGDELTYDLLGRGVTDGVFQVEGSGMKEMLRKLGPKTFSDIVAMIALYRPGVLGSGMAEDFIKRKNGQDSFEYDHELLEPILRETYGIILYQEQVMQIAHKMGGFTLAEADSMRRAMGKKDKEKLLKMQEKFTTGAMAKGVNKKTAEKVFELIGYFGGYGFNKSHSAAYAVLVYQTAYLKAHYPLHFMAALLTSEKDNSEKLRRYMLSAKEMGIRILPPCVNISGERFTVSDEAIRFGLSGIKNLGEAAVQAILQEREQGGAFTSLMDFCQRVGFQGVNTKVLETLVRSGGFDCFSARRSQLLAVHKDVLDRANSLRQDQAIGQNSLFEMMSDGAPHDEMPLLPDIPELERQEMLRDEKRLLGVHISGHPLDEIAQEIRMLSNVSSETVAEADERRGVKMVGLVTNPVRRLTKKGDPLMVFKLEDLSGSVEVVAYSEVYAASSHLLEEDRIVYLEGDAERRREELTLVASKIISFEEARIRLIRALHVVLELRELDNGVIPRLEMALGKNPGSVPVIFHVRLNEEEEMLIRAGGQIRVKPGTALSGKLDDLISADRYYYEFGFSEKLDYGSPASIGSRRPKE